MMPRMPSTLRLHQAVALETGVRSRTYAKTTDIWKLLQRAPLTSGLSRVYEPVAEDGEQFPAERTDVQVKAEPALRQAAAELTRQWDITATRDWGNCQAFADVVVDGQTLIAQAPVHYLIFLQKQLADLRAVILALPVHDPADRWVEDASSGLWRTDPPVVTRKTQKVPRNHVKAEHTERHPAQVDVYFEDVTIGHWKATKFTGGVPATRQVQLLRRVEQLQEAVIKARQDANATEVPELHVGGLVFDWLLAG